MRPSLRKDIIQTSISLFNERGYGNVSLRDISGTLGISVGNLNYYFAKKQDILQAIMAQNFLLTAAPEEIVSLAQLHRFMVRMLDSLSEHAFFFREPALYELNDDGQQHVDQLYRTFTEALERLQRKGLFQETLTRPRREAIVKLLMLSPLSWLRPSPQFRSVQSMTREEFIAAHWMLLEPYFTDAGWEEYHRTVET